jgi:predicted phosphodiesterase
MRTADGDRGDRRRWWPVAACTVSCLLLGLVVAVGGFLTDSRPVTIGAHSGRVQPTVDGWATLDLGGLLPSVRIDSGLPLSLGVRLDVTATEVASLDEVVRSDALIASAPEGEIGEVRDTLVAMAWVHAARGAGVAVLSGLVVSLLWRRAGPRGRARLRAAAPRLLHHPGPLLRPVPLAVSVLVAVSLVGVALPALSSEPRATVTWRPLTELFPEAVAVPGLEQVQIADGAEVRGAATLIQGAIDTYQASLDFYAALAEAAPGIAGRLHTADDGDVVALFISDRHDNVGMDATITAVAKAGGATVLIDGGDDTSSGASWETFSIDSLAEAAEGLDVVAVPGNHDQGDTVGARMGERGFTVLDGEPIDVAGIRFLGDADPRSSGYTPNRENGQETISEQADRLADVACDDGEVSTMLVHDPNSGLEAAERGCVDLVLSGHLHRQLGPTAVVGGDGSVATTFTNGTSGGAAYAIALGSKLRRPAQMTLVTYRQGVPIGLQPIDITTGGTFEVQPWQELPPPAS